MLDEIITSSDKFDEVVTILCDDVITSSILSDEVKSSSSSVISLSYIYVSVQTDITLNLRLVESWHKCPLKNVLWRNVPRFFVLSHIWVKSVPIVRLGSEKKNAHKSSSTGSIFVNFFLFNWSIDGHTFLKKSSFQLL
jgi:hypothetical protein